MENKLKILLTGATGFLGTYIEKVLLKQHKIIRLGRSENEEGHINADLKIGIPNLNIKGLDLVIHSAGKAHIVPKTEEERLDFFNVNVKGTENLLQALVNSGSIPKALVFISSVAVYGEEVGTDISEDAPLLAEDPYGKSKKLAETKILDWGTAHQVKITILRLPLIIGKNAPGNLGSMIQAINKGYYFNIGKGEARRSMVMADDIAQNIISISEIGGIYNLTDTIDPTYGDLSQRLGSTMGKNIRNLPVPFAKILANTLSFIESKTGKRLPFNNRVLDKMSQSLTFSSKKAKKMLNWNPKSVLENLGEII